MNISKVELDFLKQHEISDSFIFDAKGKKMSTSLKAEMKRLQKSFAINSTPCREAGHTMRSRAGHCIQCDVERIAHQSNNDQYGWVYVVGSNSNQVFKVGSTKIIDERIRSLNFGYGNITDWELLYCFSCYSSGNIEAKIHSKLNEYSWKSPYFHDGHKQDAKEIFQCDYANVKQAADHVKAELEIKINNEKEVKHKINQYNFKKLF